MAGPAGLELMDNLNRIFGVIMEMKYNSSADMKKNYPPYDSRELAICYAKNL